MGLDDRNGYKLVRFKCDVPAAKLLEGPCTRSGILGCVQCLKGATLEELAEDYSSRTADEVMKVVGAFCRPLGETRDDAVYDKIVSATKGIVADKALQKAAHMLKLKYLPNVRVLLRDPAHMIRLACKSPCIALGVSRSSTSGCSPTSMRCSRPPEPAPACSLSLCRSLRLSVVLCLA